MRMPDMRDDDGFALAAVITAMALITVIAIAGFAVAREASNSSLRNSREERAYQAASTGLDRALATFSDTDGNWPKESTINGSDSYRVDKIIYSSGDRDYELVSLGRSGETTEIVRVRFVYMDLWDMNISGGDNSNMGSGAGFNGNGTIIGKVYCNGDFDWTGSAELLGGPIFVKNGVFERQSSGNQIGTTGDPVEMYLDQDPLGVTFDSLTGKVIATRRSSPPDLDLPWLTDADMSNYLIAAQTQSAAKAYTGTKRPPNSDATYYKVLHGDTTIGTSFGTPFDKTFGTSGFGGDDFALAADGTLWLNGVVYCDGTLTIGSGVTSYRGSGMLVAKNGVVINGNLVPKGFLTGDANFIDTETTG